MSTRREILKTALATAVAGRPGRLPAPAASDVYFGTRVADPYRWLEDWSDPRVQAWSSAQSAATRRWLDGLPHVPVLRASLTRLLTRPDERRYSALKPSSSGLFALLHEGERSQPLLVFLPDPNKPETPHVVLDVLKLDGEGAVSIDWHQPSPAGDLVAVSLSRNGSEQGELHVFTTASGSLVEPPIPNVHNATAGGDLAWEPSGAGFYYTRYPRRGARPEKDLTFYQEVYHHTLGQSSDLDRYEIGRGMERTTEFRLQAQPGSGRVLATAQRGDSGQFRFFVREIDGRWRPLGAYGDGHLEARFGPNDIFLATTSGAPRGRVLRLSLQDLDLDAAAEVIAESPDGAAIKAEFYDHYASSLTVGEDRIFVVYQRGGPTELRAFDLDGRALSLPAAEPVSDVSSVTPLPGGAVLHSVESYTSSPQWRILKGTTAAPSPLTKGRAALADVEVVRDRATSRDGTLVPFTVVRRLGRSGRPPALLYGYGGYRASLRPRFRPELEALFERGFIYVEANLRGGAEFGEPWHAAGSGTSKQNVFDDFIAVATAVARRYADPKRIVISGASNGGLLVGAAVTQHPELFAGVVAEVGIYDSLRNELDPNGVFNIPELGSVKNPTQFRTLYAYSPYHRVKPGRTYPPILFMTGANDPRVNPMHSRKMAARLQAEAKGGPFLLRTSANTGHGYGTPKAARLEELVDAYAFILESTRSR